MTNMFEKFLSELNLFDIFFLTILIYNVIQCFLKGFSLSLISFMKWVLSTVVTIVLVPKFQPIVRDYIQSEFINSIGLDSYFCTHFVYNNYYRKTLSKAVTWTGVGSVDKGFGFIWFFKGYIVLRPVWFIFNWFYLIKIGVYQLRKLFRLNL